MDFNNMNEQAIQKYQEDEQLMIRLFVQWCANHQLNPQDLYQRAYPAQQDNKAMKKIIEEADDEDLMYIDNETLLDVLQLFGNEDLAFIVAEEMERLPK